MSNKMLIDATHPEETRVVVLRGNRVEEFDFESASRKQLRGNIYLAKVTRVEPSLQAAFVDYGGNRHGFLAFSEIHPDYYQIPVADRQALIEDERRAQREEDNENGGGRGERRGGRRGRQRGRGSSRNRNRDVVKSDVLATQPEDGVAQPTTEETAEPFAQAYSDHEVRGHETAAEAAAHEVTELPAGESSAEAAERPAPESEAIAGPRRTTADARSRCRSARRGGG